IEGSPNFIKDERNIAVLNTNKAVIAKHEQKMAELRRNKQVDDDINNLKSEVSDIKDMLSQILKAVSGEK
ncbi:MAG: hypothetical protein ACK55I_26150, partial [bacterium]